MILYGYAYGNPPGVMKVGSQVAPPVPWLAGNGYWTILTGVSGRVGSPSLAQTAGYDAVREDQGGWPGALTKAQPRIIYPGQLTQPVSYCFFACHSIVWPPPPAELSKTISLSVILPL